MFYVIKNNIRSETDNKEAGAWERGPEVSQHSVHTQAEIGWKGVCRKNRKHSQAAGEEPPSRHTDSWFSFVFIWSLFWVLYVNLFLIQTPGLVFD